MKHKIKSLDVVLEKFFNPFDTDDKVDKTPRRIGDGGGLLKPRKETFNINRVEYSKGAGGHYVVLSKTQFAKGEIVEICPLLVVGAEVKSVAILKDYVFEIDKNSGVYGVVLGYGSLYGHSKTPNVEYAYNKSNRQMYFMTKTVIQAGEELTIDYGKSYWDERMAFNTMAAQANLNQTPAVEEGMGLPPNADDLVNQTQAKQLGTPNNPNNPANGGGAIMGLGQQ